MKPTTILTIEIPVVTRLQDNGDGGYTTFVYNTKEELLADHPALEDDEIEGMTEEEIATLKKQILGEYDPYTNGYIGDGTIDLKITDGIVTLAKPLHFHGGQ